jgi:hypothetical protein
MRSRCFAVVAMVCVAVLVPCVPAFTDDDGSNVQLGVEWVGQYTGTGAPLAGAGNLSTSDDCVRGLKSLVSDPNTSWTTAFDWGNTDVWELDWKRPSLGGNAARLADDVDLAAFCGHGTGNCFDLATKKNDWEVTPSEMDLGLRDCEWLLAFTCNFLEYSPSYYGSAMNGAHLMCGYATDMTVTTNGGAKFAEYAKAPYGVRVAWYKYGLATQAGANRNIARTFGAISAKNDYLWGYGPVSADPVKYTADPSAYTYWDTKLNW